MAPVFTFRCCSDPVAPCLIAYWRHGSWLDAISCPLCRQKVGQAAARQCGIKKCVSDLSRSRKWECARCSRSVRCVISSRRVGLTSSRKKCWGKSQTTTNGIQVPHERWVHHKIVRDANFIMLFKLKKNTLDLPAPTVFFQLAMYKFPLWDKLRSRLHPLPPLPHPPSSSIRYSSYILILTFLKSFSPS